MSSQLSFSFASAALEPSTRPNPGKDRSATTAATAKTGDVACISQRTLGVVEWAISRIAVDSRFAAWLTGWRGLRATGWEVTVLVTSDGREAVGFGYR